MRPYAPALSLALVAGLAADSPAQCCATPTVAYSPVIAAAPAPVVATTTVNNGWYPGKYLGEFSRNLFGYGQTTTTYTAGYAPYTAGYAPYTAGYSPYAVGYAPSPYTAGYAPTYQTAYRPTYPATWGAVDYSPYVQSVSRPVVLSPVVAAPACDACGGCGACDACSGGVEQAYYGQPSSGCSSCNAGASYEAPLNDYNSNSYPEPQPALGPQDNPAPERSIRSQRPEVEDSLDTFDDLDDRTPTDPAAANDYWRAPPLFAPPANRVTKRSHPAPVQTAVYRRPASTQATAFRPADERPTATGKKHHLSADGWNATAN